MNRGFRALLLTQFLGAFNDNVLRFLIVFFVIDHYRAPETMIALSGALFVAPFLLFSWVAGYWTDRRSKRHVLLIAKAWEIPVMVTAGVGLIWDNLYILLVAIAATGIQSTFFGPAKYAIIPELVENHQLTRANALIGSTTFLGILLGALLGGFLSDQGISGISSAALLVTAIGGFFICFFIPDTRESNGINPPPGQGTTNVQSGFRMILKNTALCTAILSISYFWFLGAALQFLLPIWGAEIMKFGAAKTQSLLIAAAIGVIAGCLCAGREMVKRLGARPDRWALVGAVVSLLLWGHSTGYVMAAIALLLVGAFCGFFVVPQYTALQMEAPVLSRGKAVALNNVANTIAILGASFFLHGTGMLSLKPSTAIQILAGVTFVFLLLRVCVRIFVRNHKGTSR